MVLVGNQLWNSLQLFTLKKGFKSNHRASKLFPLLLLKGLHHNCPRQLKSFHVKAKGHINSRWSRMWVKFPVFGDAQHLNSSIQRQECCLFRYGPKVKLWHLNSIYRTKTLRVYYCKHCSRKSRGSFAYQNKHYSYLSTEQLGAAGVELLHLCLFPQSVKWSFCSFLEDVKDIKMCSTLLSNTKHNHF